MALDTRLLEARLENPNDKLVELIAEASERLKGGGGGGTSGDMTVSLKEYVDKADEAVETRMVARHDKNATKATVWGAAGTVLGIILAVLAFAGDRFDSGVSMSSVLDRVVAEQRKRDDAQDRKFDEILRRLPPRNTEQQVQGR